MARQIRFSFADAAGKLHSLVLLPDSAGDFQPAVLDGKLVAFRLQGGIARYVQSSLEISLRANLLRTTWILGCGGREFPEQPSSVLLAESVLASLPQGPPNELMDEAASGTALRRLVGRDPQGKPLPAEARDAAEFHEMLEELTPRRWVFPTIIGINFAVYLLMLSSGIGSAEDLLGWGASYAPRIGEGQGWRLLTSMFVHFGFLHVFMNMLLFVAAAPIVERIVGNAGFALLYLVSGLTGSLASLYLNPGSVGAGASGAVFGVLGGLLGLMTRYHVYVHLKDILKVAVLVVLLLINNVIDNRNRPPALGRIDVAAHVGGFLGGLACGVALCQRMSPTLRKSRRLRNLLVAGGGLVAWIAGSLLSPRVDDIILEARTFMGTDERLKEQLLSLVKGMKKGDTLLPIEEKLQREVMPEWTKACERLAALSRVPAVGRELVKALRDYGKLRGESWTLLFDAVHWNDMDRLKIFMAKDDSAERVMRDYLLSQLELRPKKKP